MDSRKDYRLQKENTERYQSPGPSSRLMDVESLEIFLQDFSPLRAIQGGFALPTHVRIPNNADMKIIHTPAQPVRTQSYLEQIDETYKQISGVIKWNEDHVIHSEEDQDQDDDIQYQSEYDSEFSEEEPQVDQQIQQLQNPEKQPKPKLLQQEPKSSELKEKLAKRNIPTTPRSATKMPNGRKVFCNCKKTKCLKLYCDCFRDGQICGDGCNCQGCHNTENYEDLRTNSMWTLMQRNPDAFKPKIETEQHQHAKGCHCKKSHCQKKYCECFQAGLKCGQHCKCEQCKNIAQQQPDDKSEDKQEAINPIRTTVKKEKKFSQWRQQIENK